MTQMMNSHVERQNWPLAPLFHMYFECNADFPQTLKSECQHHECQNNTISTMSTSLTLIS